MYGKRKGNDYYKRKINELRTTVESQRALICKLEREKSRLELLFLEVKREVERLEIAICEQASYR